MFNNVTERNHYLIASVGKLREMLQAVSVLPELEPCTQLVLIQCKEIEQIAQQNLYLIDIREQLDTKIRRQPAADFAKEIYQKTNQANKLFSLVSAYYAPTLFRASKEDRLSLRILGWLHNAHPRTYKVPAIVMNQPVSILPLNVPIYYFPILEQRGLLYQPLSFHEYGHVLYARHEQEMDELISELRAEIVDFLSPRWRRDDRFDREQATKNQSIADIWYHWMQELFCDAVGFQIGGPAYFYAFSHYLRTFAESDFHRQPNWLRQSKHPVRWLRVRFLETRVARAGFTELADQIGYEWDAAAQALGIDEDYYGYYHADLDDVIEEILTCMLEEVSPRPFTETEARGESWVPETDSPIQLLNWAWQSYWSDPKSFPMLERKTIEHWLSQKYRIKNC